MTREELAAWVRSTRTAQGLPPAVEDIATIETVAAVMRLAGPRVGESAPAIEAAA